MSAPDVPSGVLVQSVSVDEEGEGAGYRIFSDGRYQTLARGGDWVDAAPLGDTRLAAVRRAVSSERLDTLPERIHGDTNGTGNPPVLWIQVAAGDAVRTVSVVGRRRVPELERLTAALTDAFRAPGP